MPSRRRAFIAPLALLSSLALVSLGGCTYDEDGPPDAHFEKFATKPPRGDTVTVCHAYGCKAQRKFTFTESDITELRALMARVPRNDTPAEERRALAYAIAWMERRVAPAVGTASDRTSIDLRGSGDSSQLDCVDEATNTTSYLLVLDRHGLIKHHAVDRPLAKDSLTRWTHWAAVIREKESGERFAIDSGTGPNGENPTMQAAASFYVPDSYADNAPPERGLATADANSEAPAHDPGALTRMLERMQALGFAPDATGSAR
jgi:hypothetical protein